MDQGERTEKCKHGRKMKTRISLYLMPSSIVSNMLQQKTGPTSITEGGPRVEAADSLKYL